MRVFDKKDVFSWSNAEEAEKYIGKEGYFAESISILEIDIEQQNTSRLIGVDTTEVCCFHARNKGNYSLFLPADKVKEVEEEKKYRPFTTFANFLFTTSKDVGNTICYRKKKEPTIEVVSTINGFGTDSYNKLLFIEIGVLRIEPEALFEYYEWFDGNNWRSFGVEEKEE